MCKSNLMADLEGQTQKVANEIFHKPNFPVTLKFLDVVYTIKVQQGGFVKTKKSEERKILKGITGIVMPGEVLAMLGPSGSGKTTLLSALGGRLGGDLSGSIIYNEKPLSKAMNRNIGFVTQDDVLHPHLTVTETLVYTALLRLPRTMSKQQKSQHAEAVMDQLGLSKCKNSIIGGGLLRGVSGGERKRVSIGQEMLINPSLLFLDEPTSGLDSTTALKIVSTVRELADGGRTVVMTVHQPSSRLYYLFHKILLLSDGNPYYFGDGSTAMQYFSTLGFAPSVAMNPADFLLDLTNGISTADKNEDEGAIKRAMVLAYQTHLSDNLRSKLVGGDDNKPQHSSPVDDNWSNSWCAQFSVLLQRGIKERKHESFSILRIAEVLIVAFMAGLLWWQSDSSHIQDQVGLFFFYTVFWGFYPLFQSVFTFPQECLTLSKERSSSMYRLSPYLMALTIGDLPMELILPSVFYTITYWMAGFKATAGSFFSGLFILLYSVLCTQGLGLAIGAVVMDQKAAIALGSVIMLSSLLASGFYVQNVPSFISWIKYLSIAQHTFKLLLVSQYSRDETYVCDTTNNVSCLVEDFPAVKNVGLHGYVVSLFAMGGMLLAYRLVAYIALTKIGVTRR